MVGLVIPLFVGWLPRWYALFEGLVFSGVFVLGVAWLQSITRQRRQRDLLNWTTDLRRLDANEFEWLVLELFRREGYEVEHTGSPHRGDGNIDLIATKDEESLVVQCKRWQSWYVGPDVVQRLAGTFPARGDVTGRVLVTLSDFTESARRTAEHSQIRLIDGSELAERVLAVRRSEPCPLCGTPMILDRSMRGWWLRCPRYAEGCMGKRDLSQEPGRAVGLLTAQDDRGNVDFARGTLLFTRGPLDLPSGHPPLH